MKLKFFVGLSRGPVKKPAGISASRKGMVTLNAAACTALGAEQGENATICQDEESGQWLLAHWPNGAPDQPTLRPPSSKGASSLRFQSSPTTQALFAAVPGTCSTSLNCLLEPEAITSAEHPEASFYLLTLPEAANDPIPMATAKAKDNPVGVGRGHYDRSKAKGAVAA